MPPDARRVPRRRRKTGDLQQYTDAARRARTFHGPLSPTSGVTRARLERQYRSLIAGSQRKPRYSGDLAIYKSAQIKRMSTPQLRKILQGAYRTPSI